jgi:hypothetical protein
MSDQRSVGKFCSITAFENTGVGLDSIQEIDGSKLGEGAEAFCTSTGQSYRWTSATITAFGLVFITPATGGGTWVMQGYEQFLSCSAVGSAAFSGAGAHASLGLNLWTTFPAGASFYTTGPGFTVGQLVTVEPSFGFMVLNNTMGSFRSVPLLVTMQFSVTSSALGHIFEFDLTPSPGGNIGLNVQSQTAAQATLLSAGPTSVSLTRLFIPTANVDYYPVWRCLTSGATTLSTSFYQMSIVSAGSST